MVVQRKGYEIDQGGEGCGYTALAIAVLRQAMVDLTKNHIDASDQDTAHRFVFSNKPLWTSVREHWCSQAGLDPSRYRKIVEKFMKGEKRRVEKC